MLLTLSTLLNRERDQVLEGKKIQKGNGKPNKHRRKLQLKKKSWTEPIVNLCNANVDCRRVSSRRVTFKNTRHFHLSPPRPLSCASPKKRGVTYASDRGSSDWRGNRADTHLGEKCTGIVGETRSIIRPVRLFLKARLDCLEARVANRSRSRRINKSVREDTLTYVDPRAPSKTHLSLRTGHVVLPKKSGRDSRMCEIEQPLPPSVLSDSHSLSLFLSWTTVRDSVPRTTIRAARTLPQLAAATWSDVREFGWRAEVRAAQGKQRRTGDRDTNRAARDVGDEIVIAI